MNRIIGRLCARAALCCSLLVVAFAVFAATADATNRDHDRGRDSSSHHEFDKQHDRDDDNDHDCATQNKCGGVRLSGAIFTTDENGSVVNGNLYDAATDVYLGGGPIVTQSNASGKKSGSKNNKSNKGNKNNKGDKKKDDRDRHEYGKPQPASLPDGVYYFQVTDPSGKTLLSLDGIENRQFEVVDGYIQDVSGSHNYNVMDSPFPPNYTVVQLIPFRPTPNRGGTYKLWVTPVASYQPGQGSHGFLPSCSKTDNFRVRSSGTTLTAYLTGEVFYDTNLNGVFDAGEPYAPNVTILVYPQGSTVSLEDPFVTGDSGQWSFQLTPPSLPYTYRVEPVVGTDVNLAPAPTLPPAYDYEVTIETSGQVVENLRFGVVKIGTPLIPIGDTGDVTGANIEFYPGYWSNSPDQGEVVLDRYFADNVELDPNFPVIPDFLAADILKQTACKPAGPLLTPSAVKLFLPDNSAATASAGCQIAALWLSLNLAIETTGTPVNTTVLAAGEVLSITGTEMVYYGLDPVTGQPRYGTVRALLNFVAGNFSAGNFSALTPDYAVFYASALQQTSIKKNFVRGFSGNPTEF
jgi:hypothetical protein